MFKKLLLSLLAVPGLLLGGRPSVAQNADYSQLPDPFSLQFPSDFGAHNGFRTEWWYITGWLDDHGHAVGFQLTFFRSRLLVDTLNPSAFNPQQLYFAHAAISDPRIGHALFAQRAMRQAFDLAGAAEGETDVHLLDWSLKREAHTKQYTAQARDAELGLDLSLSEDALPLPEGAQGRSQKSPIGSAASGYYSEPQLKVTGTIFEHGHALQVHGRAWLDHEWSSSYLDPQAQGWDWLGCNFADGSAMMAFRMRRKDGGILWSGATRRAANGDVRSYSPDEVQFLTTHRWRSPHSGVTYPIGQTVSVGPATYQLQPLFDDQEIDARASTGTLYWEGAVRVAPDDPQLPSGEGYLEMTGYGDALRLP